MKRSIPLDHHGYPISKLETDAQIVADSVNPAAWDGFQGNLQYKVVPQWAKSRSWCGYNSNFTTWFMVDISIRQLWFINQQTSLGGTILYRTVGGRMSLWKSKIPQETHRDFLHKNRDVRSPVPSNSKTWPLSIGWQSVGGHIKKHLEIDDERVARICCHKHAHLGLFWGGVTTLWRWQNVFLGSFW